MNYESRAGALRNVVNDKLSRQGQLRYDRVEFLSAGDLGKFLVGQFRESFVWVFLRFHGDAPFVFGKHDFAVVPVYDTP